MLRCCNSISEIGGRETIVDPRESAVVRGTVGAPRTDGSHPPRSRWIGGSASAGSPAPGGERRGETDTNDAEDASTT
jgi:hypothetical protein